MGLLSREHPKAQGRLIFVVVYGETRDRTCDPWFTRRVIKPLHHGGFGSSKPTATMLSHRTKHIYLHIIFFIKPVQRRLKIVVY